MKSVANVNIIDLADGRQVCQSYGVTVGAFIPRSWLQDHAVSVPASFQGGMVRTSERYSVTTSRHTNAFAGKDAAVVDHATLLELTSPVSSRR